jgi:hypothetical protein
VGGRLTDARSGTQPISWTGLGVTLVVGSGLVYYFQQERERKNQKGVCAWVERVRPRPHVGRRL